MHLIIIFNTMKICNIFILLLFTAFITNTFSIENDNKKVMPWNIHGKLEISDNGHFFVYSDGTPFFLLADTAWGLFNRLNKEEANVYITDRAEKKFNAIQVFLISHWMETNTYNESPFIKGNPINLNPNFINHVNFIIELAASEGLYILLSIGKVFQPTIVNENQSIKNKWYLENEKNAYKFGQSLANYLGHHKNIIWSLGHDFNPKNFRNRGIDVRHLVRATAKGIADKINGVDDIKGTTDYSSTLMTFHPKGYHSSSDWFHNDPWLDFNMIQTNIISKTFTINRIKKDISLLPYKPTLEGEPPYEGENSSCVKNIIRLNNAYDVRKSAYWSVFSGAAGFTYGHTNIWKFWSERPYTGGYDTVGTAKWEDSLDSQGANQLLYLLNLINLRPIHNSRPSHSLLTHYSSDKHSHILALREKNGNYALIYSTNGDDINVDLSQISGDSVNTWWYNPRNGNVHFNGRYNSSELMNFNPPAKPNKKYDLSGSDWVLVIDNANLNIPIPGKL